MTSEKLTGSASGRKSKRLGWTVGRSSDVYYDHFCSPIEVGGGGGDVWVSVDFPLSSSNLDLTWAPKGIFYKANSRPILDLLGRES